MRNWRLFPSTAGKLTSSLNFRATDSTECRNCVPARPDDFSARCPTSTPNRWRPTPTLVPLSWRTCARPVTTAVFPPFLFCPCATYSARSFGRNRAQLTLNRNFFSGFLTFSERRRVGEVDLGEVKALSQRCFCSESRNWSQKGQCHMLGPVDFYHFQGGLSSCELDQEEV